MALPQSLPLALQHLEHKLRLLDASTLLARPKHGPLVGWPELDALLGGQGLPKGLVELQAYGGLGGGSSVALACVRAAHRASPQAWCAWVDPGRSLYAPGVALAGVSLARLLVVQPRYDQVLRTALRLVRAAAFETVVVDAEVASEHVGPGAHTALENTARKLAMYAEDAGLTVLLLTHAGIRRRTPLPAVMRVELRREPGAICVQIAKEKAMHGARTGLLSWAQRPYGLCT